MGSQDGEKVTEFGDDRVFNDLRYTINSDKLHALGWTEVRDNSGAKKISRERRGWSRYGTEGVEKEYAFVAPCVCFGGGFDRSVPYGLRVF